MADSSQGIEDPQKVEEYRERIRELTEKGKEQYEECINAYRNTIDQAWENVQTVLDELADCDVEQLNNLEERLHASYEKYSRVSNEFMEYLYNARTSESRAEFQLMKRDSVSSDKLFKGAMNQIKIMRNVDAKSVSTTSSRKSRARAKLEAILEKVKLAEEEAALQKRKAIIRQQTDEEQINADLNVLRIKREAVDAEVEVNVADEDAKNVPHYLSIPVDKNRTERYITDHFGQTKHYDFYAASAQPDENVPFVSNTKIPFQQSPRNDSNLASQLTTFLLKKDLLMTRLTTFDEKPEHYLSWKVNFKGIISELYVTPSEEIDLLIRWLGPNSGRHAKTIRSSLSSDPTWGVDKIWERLDERFGAPEMVEAAIKERLSSFPRIRNNDNKKFYELVDIMIEIESLMANPQYTVLLSYFNSSSGVLPIINKLPYNIQEKWTMKAANYKKQHSVPFPPFSFVLNFVKEISKIRNDPSFSYLYEQQAQKPNIGSRPALSQKPVIARKMEVKSETKTNWNSDGVMCPVHSKPHSLNICREFSTWDILKRREFLKKKGICFKCCETNSHLMKDCKQSVRCAHCQSVKHSTAMHIERREQTESDNKRTLTNTMEPQRSHGGENSKNDNQRVIANCTSLCDFTGRSCSKTVLVRVFPYDKPEKAITTYAILDEHSNKTLASSELMDLLGVDSPSTGYRLSSCAGIVHIKGRRATGYVVESWDGTSCHTLPTVIECNKIPNDASGIPTPEVAKLHSHLNSIADKIPPLVPDGKILLLIGRDLIDAHHVENQITGPQGTPFAQKLSLGWVIVGEVCIGKFHKADTNVNTLKTNLLLDGRTTLFDPCHSKISVREQPVEYSIGNSLFVKSQWDEEVGTSYEDRKFMTIMDSEFTKDDTGSWVAPLPFKAPRTILPDNKKQVLQRARQLESSLRRNPGKLKHFVAFMEKVINNGAAEKSSKIEDDKERWYLPIFGVYYPKKPNQVRGVFDSSVIYQGQSLNNVLLSGPNLTNSLLGVLLRFRKDQCAITADIEQMFYRFFVKPEHRDYLRFFWFQDNNPDLPMIEYRMTVHVFGNRPSPAVATYGLRKAVKNSEADIREFVNRNFYVDDALISLPSADMAVSLLKRTREKLRDEGNIKLHKIASNDKTVTSQFSKEDLGKDLKDLDIGDDSLPLQHSLGLAWNLNTDSFIFTAPVVDNPFTRRGLLSTVSSIFDPIGFLSPFTVSGRMLLRKACPEGIDWDETLSDIHKDSWQTWIQNLNLLNGYKIPRMYAPTSLSLSKDHSVLIYSDASEKAVAAAAYLQMTDMNDQHHLGFVMGKAKLAPQAGHSIPRLELCAAVLATEIGQFVVKQLDILPSKMKYFTDSKVVLGYIKNKTRRFYTYVSNRVSLIQQFTSCDQWNYVPSHLNPADAATRDSSMDILSAINVWLKGPKYRLHDNELLAEDLNEFPLIEPENDKEIRPVQVLKSTILTCNPISERFTHHSSWNRLVNAFTVLRHIARTYRKENSCKGWHLCKKSKSSEAFEETRIFLLKQTQEEYFKCETDNLKQGLPVKKNSSIISLSPYLDEQGLLRVGGRLNRLRNKLGLASTNPIIVPKGHIATLLIRHFHEKTFHQGRKITEGEIRSNGFWIIGAKRLISTLIKTCVLCRKLRGKVEVQKMADLPEDRLTPGPPFSAVGVDTFGPWNVTTRRTRGGAAQSKRWAIIFTCLTTRAVHIELVEEMSSSSFINALRRITAIRGPIKIFRSDRGTNFIGATDQIGIESINVEDTKVKQHLDNTGSVWKFNSPHSSHMGGVWERMIGITRRILDGILLQQNKKELTHEVLSTLMAEVSAVINSRPITAISSDPECPIILSPNILLTQKQGEVPAISGEFSIRDIYTADWKHVQVLSDMFWKKWQENYLQELQTRQKWCLEKPNIKPGDIVFVKDKGLARNDWPIGVVEEAIKSDDNLVRKAVVRIYHEGKHVSYTRPITELVLLLEE